MSICQLSISGGAGMGRVLTSLDSLEFARMSDGTRLAVKRKTLKRRKAPENK